MIRLMPDMQVGPTGYFLSWFIVIMAAVGVLFATGLGGAAIWTVFWIGVAIAIYLLLGRVFG